MGLTPSKRRYTIRFMSKATSIAVVLLWLAGCGGEGEFSPAAPPGDRAALEAMWERAGGEEPTGDAARRRLLAALAVDKGLAGDFDVGMAFRQALAQAYLRKKFEVEHGPDRVPLETWESIYWERGARPIFDHFDTFFVTDVQMLCCKGSPDLCARDSQVQACMRDSEPDIWRLYEALSQTRFANPTELKKALEPYKGYRFPNLKSQDYSFQYNFSLPHNEQRGYTVVNRNVAEAARSARLKTLTKPVQSNNGWHILYVKEFLPEAHDTPDDPAVIKELQKRFYPIVRRNDVLAFLEELLKDARVKVYKDTLREMDWAELTGLHP